MLLAFEMIGGVEAMAAWAEENRGEFYTKLFPKVITREVEVNASEGIEDLLRHLDNPHFTRREAAGEEPREAEWEPVVEP